MQLKTWKEYLKKCSKAGDFNLFYHLYKTGKNQFKIVLDSKKVHTKTKNLLKNKGLIMSFKNSKSLTIFEVNTLYYLFVRRLIPYDYAKYHSCKAGIEFIESIEYAKVCIVPDAEVQEIIYK